MALKLITDAATEPVTRAEAALFMRYTGTLQNDVIDSQIAAATRYVQNWCNVQLVNATFDYYTDDLYDIIKLPNSPISSVTSIKYQDEADAEQTLTSTLYKLDNISPIPKILRKYNKTYPSVLDEPNTVVVRYVAGYGATADSVPEYYKNLIKTIVAEMFEHREGLTESQLRENPNVQRMLHLGAHNYRF